MIRFRGFWRNLARHERLLRNLVQGERHLFALHPFLLMLVAARQI